MKELTRKAEALAGRQGRGRNRARTVQAHQAIGREQSNLLNARSGRVAENTIDKNPRGYRVDYPKLKALCRQAGLKMVDLSEPGLRVAERLISAGAIKKWRGGGYASIDSLSKIATVLSDRLGWRMDWRELTQAAMESLPHDRRLAILPFHAVVGEGGSRDGVDGFRASIVSQLSKLRGLRVLSTVASDIVASGQLDHSPLNELCRSGVEAVLTGAMRAHGDMARLDVELTDLRTREVLWASSYPFSEADQLRAQTAIAAEVANQIGRTLAA